VNKTLEAIREVANYVGAVGKTGTNTSQNYKFRGVDAVINAVSPALRRQGLVIWPELISIEYDTSISKSGTQQQIARLLVRYNVQAIDGEPISGIVAAEAFDTGDKATAKAMSVAYRTFMIQLLCLPTDEPDPDESSYDTRPKPKPASATDWLKLAAEAKNLDELKVIYGQAQKSGANDVVLEQIKQTKK
jgi:hypothetical protein